MTRLSRRTATTTRFSPKAARNRRLQGIANIRSGGLLPRKHSPDGATTQPIKRACRALLATVVPNRSTPLRQARSYSSLLVRAGLRHWGPHAKGHGGPPLPSPPLPSPALPYIPLPSPLPLPPVPSSALSLPSSSLPSLRSRPPKYSYGVLESAVSYPNGDWGKAPADKRFGAYLSQKALLWWQQFLWSFSQEYM